MKRQDISGLEKNRPLYMKFGLIIAVSFAILAFNFTVYDTPGRKLGDEKIIEDIFDPVVRTPPEFKPKLPPPAFKASENIIPDDPDFTETPVPDTLVSDIVVDSIFKKEPQPKIAIHPPKKPDVKPELPKEKEAPIFMVVEEMPRFPGCEETASNKTEKAACAQSALLKYIYSNIKYPAMAVENHIEGDVIAQFVVERDGSISDLTIVRDIGGGCGREVTRIVKNMPNWIPGKQRGNPVL